MQLMIQIMQDFLIMHNNMVYRNVRDITTTPTCFKVLEINLYSQYTSMGTCMHALKIIYHSCTGYIYIGMGI